MPPWAKVDTVSGIVKDIYQIQPDLDVDELEDTTVVEVGPDIAIGNTIELEVETEQPKPPHHEVKAAKPPTPEQQ